MLALAVIVTGLISLQSLAGTAGKISIAEERDFMRLAAQAADKQQAILLVFGTRDCLHCDWLEDQVLKPMIRSGEYTDRILIRKLRLDVEKPLVNFAGKHVSSKRLAERYSVYLAPTVVLLDASGMPVSNPIIGIPNRHFYARKLDRAIDEALSRIRKET